MFLFVYLFIYLSVGIKVNAGVTAMYTKKKRNFALNKINNDFCSTSFLYHSFKGSRTLLRVYQRASTDF